MIDYIEKAKAFAMMAHKGQTDKAGEDYFTAHVAVVADGVEPDPLVKAAAYLHDTVEDTDNKPQLQAYHDARWGGIGIAEARDLLIPQLRKLRVGWNGNFGISNAGLAYNSKLAYEMLKAILYACRQGDGTVLKVTDEPLMYAPCKSNLHAL